MTGIPLDPRLLRHDSGFPFGYTRVTEIGATGHDTGMELGILKLRAGETHSARTRRETAWLLLDGDVELRWPGPAGASVRRCRRASLFDDEPSALHVPAGCVISAAAKGDTELLLLAAANARTFTPRLFAAEDFAAVEQRDKGKLADASWRIVRTIFDRRNRPEAALVLGEVVHLPGRWSSYPPHHHPQPEIYHYRFDHPCGYGHAELGDDVLKVRHGDTVLILDENDHAQVAAPGYAMMYVWAIRHLPGRPYSEPELNPDHAWLCDPSVRPWRPAEPADAQQREEETMSARSRP